MIQRAARVVCRHQCQWLKMRCKRSWSWKRQK